MHTMCIYIYILCIYIYIHNYTHIHTIYMDIYIFTHILIIIDIGPVTLISLGASRPKRSPFTTSMRPTSATFPWTWTLETRPEICSLALLELRRWVSRKRKTMENLQWKWLEISTVSDFYLFLNWWLPILTHHCFFFSIYLHKKFMFPDKVLAFLLQCSQSNPGEWLDPTQKKHVALYWKPSFAVLTWLLKVHDLLHVDLS